MGRRRAVFQEGRPGPFRAVLLRQAEGLVDVPPPAVVARQGELDAAPGYLLF